MTSRKGSPSEFMLRARGTALEVRRRLRLFGRGFGRGFETGVERLAPAARPLGRGLAAIAPSVTGALWFALRVSLSLLAAFVDFVHGTLRLLGTNAGTFAAGLTHRLAVAVTPVRALAAVCTGAAVALAVSQFTDYSGVAVGASSYSGDIEAVAPAPQTALETAGSAHFYVLVPLAVLALVLTWMTARGRWKLGRAIAAVGLAGIVVTLAIDLPQGLDSGRAGEDYLGTDARLIEGFWSQLAASVALVAFGPLLGLYARRAHDGAPTAPRSRARRRRRRGRRLGSPQPRNGRAAVARAEART
jgi:hypothetical protein